MNGKVQREMDMGFKFGQMGQNMKGNGDTTKQLEEASSHIVMETHMKESGKTIWLMGMECICMWTVQNTKDNGSMINSMVMGLKFGLMALPTMGSFKIVKNMEKVNTTYILREIYLAKWLVL